MSVRERAPRVWFAQEYDPIANGSIDGAATGQVHDKALVRALRRPYKASLDPKIQGNPYCTLFLARLHYDTTEDTIRKHFGKENVVNHIDGVLKSFFYS